MDGYEEPATLNNDCVSRPIIVRCCLSINHISSRKTLQFENDPTTEYLHCQNLTPVSLRGPLNEFNLLAPKKSGREVRVFKTRVLKLVIFRVTIPSSVIVSISVDRFQVKKNQFDWCQWDRDVLILRSAKQILFLLIKCFYPIERTNYKPLSTTKS